MLMVCAFSHFVYKNTLELYQNFYSCKIYSLKMKKHVLKLPILSHLFRLILSKANIIICENQHFEHQLVQLGFPNEKIIVLRNGIDLKQFKAGDKLSAPANLKLPEGKLNIVSVGSLTRNKGHIYLIHAVSDLLKKGDNIHLYIVGTGDEYQSLKSEIEQLQLNENITLAGRASHESIAHWLNAAKIFVLPSLHEGTPNALLEAMASGLPVITSAIGGIPEIITNGENGFLVTPASTKENHLNLDFKFSHKIP